MNMNEPSTLCIYHADCLDGFAAAWVVKQALGDYVEFFPGYYGKMPPPVCGKHVVLVDFSYPYDTLMSLVTDAKSVLVLDHHVSARTDLSEAVAAARKKGILFDVVYDEQRSGARIAWDYYFPNDVVPDLLLHVEDRDLWRFNIAFTREVIAALGSYPYDFAVWHKFMRDDPLEALAPDGFAILRKQDKDIKELCRAALRSVCIDGRTVPALNVPYMMASEAGHVLAENEPFAATYFDSAGLRNFSLRSREGGADVSVIAKKYGGGGHKHAAGFRVTFEQARAFEVASDQQP